MKLSPTLKSFEKRSHIIFLILLHIRVIYSSDFSFQFLEKKGIFTYGNFLEKFNGSVLRKNDSTLLKIEVPNDIECASQCLINSLCLSVNYGVDPNKKGSVQCQLLSWGGTDYSSYLVKKEGFFHMRMQTICSTRPCGMVAYCIPRLTGNYEKPFTCACPRNSSECLKGNIKCNALGVEAGIIADAQMTASSTYSTKWAAHKARLNKASSWIPRSMAKSWLQVNIGRSTTVEGVATQGRFDSAKSWVKTYQLVFSNEGDTWATYKEDGVVKNFKGNINSHSVVKHVMKEPFIARQVRIVPKTYYVNFGLRMELYGCYN